MRSRAPRSARVTACALVVVVVASLSSVAQARQSTAAPPADHAERFEKGTRLFTAKVAAILTSRCLKCHGGEAVRGGLDLSTRELLLAGGKNGDVIQPFAATESRLLKLVRHEEKPGMPFKADPLSEEEIAALADWVDLGAPYGAPLKGVEPAKPGTRPRGEVTDADRDFWSFRSLARPPLPEVKEAAWCLTPVDRFVKARLEAASVVPAGDAPRRTLARRAFFDLVGEPPAPAEVDRFLADCGPQAWHGLVERLLADRRFGERWGRHWLDLARFAESHGFEHDYDRANAWTYRDFVIRAFAADLPFDQFVRWQIAGDELAPDDPEAWYATGFLGAGVHATQITASQVEKERYDELDDVVATIGTSMLGLTIGCARCHDHKYDPIPTRDYYRLLSTFTKTVRSDYDVVTDAAEFREQTKAWDAAHAPLTAALERFERETMEPRIAGFIAAHGEKGTLDRHDAELAARTVAPWIVLEPAALVASGGATFTRLADGSWLAGGERPDHDDYTFTTHVDAGVVTQIGALRIEALSDPSLPHGGPGRADNGNFGLTEMTASYAADSATGAPPPAPLAFAAARATFEQAGLPASAAIDGNDAQDSACWAVDPQFGKDHAAAFELAAPLDVAAGGTLVVTLHFHTNVHHGIGRLRVCACDDARADIAAPARPLALAAALATLERGDGGLTPEERSALETWLKNRDPEWRQLRDAVVAHESQKPKPKTQKAMICSEGVPAIRLHTQGGDFLDATHFLKRGDPGQKLEVATQSFLQVLMRSSDGERRWQQAPAAGSEATARTSGQRSALARWLTDVDQGAGGLVARVAVNRIWQHLFGRGLVTTPSDFGAAGERPSHPELLDWLACELVESGWSVKHVVALLVSSRVYLEGGGDESVRRADPEEKLFARHPARRLEAESVRDAMLAVSGKLDDRPFGPGTLDVASPRRSVYLFVKRSRMVPMMTLFDAPNALSGLGRRQVTTVAPQSLFLMNDPVVREWAAAFAHRLADAHTDADFVRGAFELAFARPPADGELADALAFLAADADALAREGKTPPLEQARVDLCQALFSANEFVYVE